MYKLNEEGRQHRQTMLANQKDFARAARDIEEILRRLSKGKGD